MMDISLNEQVLPQPKDNLDFDFDFNLLKINVQKTYKQIGHSRKTRKYYRLRYHLFHLFDDGILFADRESWYSVTPEAVARHCAQSCANRLAHITKSLSRSSVTSYNVPNTMYKPFTIETMFHSFWPTFFS
jgi:6-pyruvoyl-tetrahydropterin synthase